MPLTDEAEGERRPVGPGAGIRVERLRLETGGKAAALRRLVDTEGGRSIRFPSAGKRPDAEPGTAGASRTRCLDYVEWRVGSTVGRGLPAVGEEGRT